MTSRKMTGEAIVLKQFEYQKMTNEIIAAMNVQGYSKAEIAEEVGLHSAEVTDFLKRQKRESKRGLKSSWEYGTTGHSFFNGSIFDI